MRTGSWALVVFAGVLAGCGEPVACGHPSSSQWAADCTAWSLFAQINRRAANGAYAQWELWPEVSQVFGSKPPEWPSAPPGDKRLRMLLQFKVDEDVRLRAPLGGENTEARMNRATFDFIKSNGFWNREGLKVIAQRGVDFPKDSIEVKAAWEPDVDGAGARGDYHVQHKAPDHATIRLTGFHLTSKVIPNWLWATWKHESTSEDPSDDSFGYPGGKRSAELDRLFAYHNVGPEWQHYRLIGSQSDFVKSTGEAVLLGNSKLELGLARTTSCMTCHAMARVDETGRLYKGVKCVCGSDLDGCKFRGAPIAATFEGLTQLDFVFSFREITDQLFTPGCTR